MWCFDLFFAELEKLLDCIILLLTWVIQLEIISTSGIKNLQIPGLLGTQGWQTEVVGPEISSRRWKFESCVFFMFDIYENFSSFYVRYFLFKKFLLSYEILIWIFSVLSKLRSISSKTFKFHNLIKSTPMDFQHSPFWELIMSAI